LKCKVGWCFHWPLKQPLTNLEDALAKERADNVELRKELEAELQMAKNKEDHVMIPRPKGSAGTHFSIQEAMGLSGSTKKYDTYKAIQVRRGWRGWEPYADILLQRNLRDLMLNARINWEVCWAKIPCKDKGILFEIVSYWIAQDKMSVTYLTRLENNTHFWEDSSTIGPQRSW
jgi:hypothetical protein